MIDTTFRKRVTGLLEVFGVYASGQLVSRGLIRLFGIRPVNPLAHFTASVTDAQLLTATWQLFVLLVIQYAGWFALIVPINWWHRRSGPAAYGLTRSDRSFGSLVLIGSAT